MNFKELIDVLGPETVLEIKIYNPFQSTPICEGSPEVSNFKNDPEYTKYLGEILKVRFIKPKEKTHYVVFDQIKQISFKQWKQETLN